MEMIYNHGHNILSFSEQVNRSVITSNKHGIYELLHEFPSNSRLRILRN